MNLETPMKIRMLQRKLYQKAKEEPSYRFYLLYDKMYREDLLAHAYALAKSNQGAPGVDGQSFWGIESQGLEEWLIGNGFPRRTFDHRTLDGLIVPKHKFFVTQHFNQPEIDPNTYRLKLAGMVKKPLVLSLADLRKMRPTEMIVGYECSGN